MHIFIISKDRLYACGYNYHGQLGINNLFRRKKIFTKFNKINHKPFFIAVSCGYDHTVALDIEGNIWGTGGNYDGQLGFKRNNIISKELTKLLCEESFIDISCGAFHTIAIDTNGNLWSTGVNECGQLGIGTRSYSRNKYAKIISDVIFTSVSCGVYHTIALDINGNLWGAGYNICGQIGIEPIHENGTDFIINLIKLTFDTIFIDISCGSYHSVALDNKGNIWSTGGNYDGQLGFNDNVCRVVFSKVPCHNNMSFITVSCGDHHTIAIDTDGNLWSTGLNESGQLGLGDLFNRKELTQAVIPANRNFRAISCKGNYSIALDSEGNIWSTGDNEQGQLGLGDNKLRKFFTQVPNIKADRLFDQAISSKVRIKGSHMEITN